MLHRHLHRTLEGRGWQEDDEDSRQEQPAKATFESAGFQPDALLLQASIARAQETVLYRQHIPLVLDLRIPVWLSLACYAPKPASYLRRLYHLGVRDRETALGQLRYRLAIAWNSIERSYLGAVLTLIALKEEDFHRAYCKQLEVQAYKRMPLDVEYRVLKLHASAGAGERRSSRSLFESLIHDPGCTGKARTCIQLLDHAYGFTGNATSRPALLHDQIIANEAGMLAVAGSAS